MTPSNTPILILIFNRPQKVRQLISALGKIKPQAIYVSADGPRASIPTDIEKCAEARALFSNLPWQCEVHTHFSEVNLGCMHGPVSGLNWFFSQVEEGIVLEDDCIPHPSFFNFCTTLLEKYRQDTKVMHISGNNFQDGISRGDGSYYFSLYTHSWGWATWRRAWEKYEPALAQFKDFDKTNRIQTLVLSKDAQRFWIKNFRYTIRGNDSWDSLWLYTVWQNNGLAILPNKNLVSNIGFDADATHTTIPNQASNIETNGIDVIIHPTKTEVDFEADELTFKKLFYKPLQKRALSKLNAIIASLWK